MDKDRKINRIMNVIIALLLVCMVCLCIIYLFSFEKTNEVELSKDDVTRIRTGNAKLQYTKLFDQKYVLPTYFALCSNGSDDYVLFSNETRMNNLLSNIKPLFSDLINEETFIIKMVDEDAGVYYRDALSGNGILLEWHDVILSDILYSICFKSDIPNGYYSGIPIKKMFILPSDDSCEIILFDSTSNIYIFRNTYDSNEDNKGLSIYNSIDKSQMTIFDFAMNIKQDNVIYKGLSDDTVIPREIRYRNIELEKYSVDTITLNSNMFESLNIGLAKASIYTEPNGSVIYMHEGKRLYIKNDGTIEYTSDETSGLSLYDMIGLGQNYELMDYVGACFTFLDSAGFNFGSGTVYLKSIGVNGREVNISFGLMYNGVAILYGDNNAYSFRFINGTLVNAIFNPIEVMERNDYKKPTLYDCLARSFLSNGDENITVVYIQNGDYLSAKYFCTSQNESEVEK